MDSRPSYNQKRDAALGRCLSSAIVHVAGHHSSLVVIICSSSVALGFLYPVLGVGLMFLLLIAAGMIWCWRIFFTVRPNNKTKKNVKTVR
jgi:hypothetical protein